VGGVVDIIDHEKNGLLVPPKDIEAMAKAVIRLHRDQALSQRLTVEAKKKLKEQFTIERMAEMTLQVYDELLRSTNFGHTLSQGLAAKISQSKNLLSRWQGISANSSGLPVFGWPHCDRLPW
jgi:hypothetical protein